MAGDARDYCVIFVVTGHIGFKRAFMASGCRACRCRIVGIVAIGADVTGVVSHYDDGKMSLDLLGKMTLITKFCRRRNLGILLDGCNF